MILGEHCVKYILFGDLPLKICRKRAVHTSPLYFGESHSIKEEALFVFMCPYLLSSAIFCLISVITFGTVPYIRKQKDTVPFLVPVCVVLFKIYIVFCFRFKKICMKMWTICYVPVLF